ncbi:hypothetical protein SAMN04489724_3011 [Algoriphagus locisalis]|uniref:Uncharacterized protein n=1 Tax=Algoriphagus locisalis TaxID=305507 RepID=A0A1I7CAG8_9BACT|nr:hypothetical protein [Algoriphagus locisalis]SFT96429.1 hypothetical protein SAMN04489724_3011 [Algoriphagus locisalis]
MQLTGAFKGAKIIEAIENYRVLADKRELVTEEEPVETEEFCRTDSEFWSMVFSLGDEIFTRTFSFGLVGVSNWVARIPGLYWTPAAHILRENADSNFILDSKFFNELNPNDKSKKVLGGVGCIKIPPDEVGNRIITISTQGNTSSGIPVLINAEIFEKLKLEQGDELSVSNAKWRGMSADWAKRFATVKEVPRGYLVVDSDSKIVKLGKSRFQIYYHPYSILQYESNDSLLYDFVFMTVINDQDERNQIEDFFEYYRTKNNRFGTYLINPDLVNPCLDAKYSHPIDMVSPSEQANVNLIYERIRGIQFNNVTIDELLEILPKYYNSAIALKKLADNIGISPSLLMEDSGTVMGNQLISLCIKRNKIEELIDRLVVDYPRIFNLNLK